MLSFVVTEIYASRLKHHGDKTVTMDTINKQKNRSVNSVTASSENKRSFWL